MSLYNIDHLFIESARFFRLWSVNELFLNLDIQHILTRFAFTGGTHSRVNHHVGCACGRVACRSALFTPQHFFVGLLGLFF